MENNNKLNVLERDAVLSTLICTFGLQYMYIVPYAILSV
jgi:hypothetical protein